jgi:hypothetical protein
MALYIRASRDAPWHWCENCENYPDEIANTSPTRPRDKLCDHCEVLDQAGDCDESRD